MADGESGPIEPRIGTFFLLMGSGLIILFIASDTAGKANFDYFFYGVIGLVIGFFLRRKAPAPPPSNRFSGLRKMRENAKKRKEEKAKKKKK
jgi:hypothetical protein